MLSKYENRELLKKQRAKFRAEQVLAYSKAINIRCIKAINWEKIRKLHCYLAIDVNNEVKTDHILQFVRTKHPDIIVTIAPKASTIIPRESSKYDAVIVPVLGFSDNGYRLGYGGGYYDRFLIDQPTALYVGLAYEGSYLADGFPIDTFDVPLHQIHTEQKTRNINTKR